jgi:uncharacterized protein YuzB (UPF0349 family)
MFNLVIGEVVHGGSRHIRGGTTVLHILTDCDLDNVDISASILLSIVDIGSSFMFNLVIGGVVHGGSRHIRGGDNCITYTY